MGNVESNEAKTGRGSQSNPPQAIFAYPSYPSHHSMPHHPLSRPAFEPEQVSKTKSAYNTPVPGSKPTLPINIARKTNLSDTSQSRLGPAADSRIAISKTRCPVTVSNVEAKLDQFEDEQRRLQEAIDRIKARRAEMFQRELAAFEQKFNPFEVLGLSDVTDDVDLIKKAYRKQSLRHHPDKGGSEVKFEAVTKAYVYIMKRLDKLNYKIADDNQLRKAAQEHVESQEQNATENIYIDKDNFNVTQFNDIFDKYRLDLPEDDGYGQDMETSDRSRERQEIPVKRLFDGKFNRDVFNSVFADTKASDDEKQIIVHDEPQPLVSSGLDYYELGTGKIDDFGRNDRVASGKYTDYKHAYGRDSKLIDVTSVNYKQYKNVEDLEKDRKNVSYDMSPETRRKLEIKRQKEELEDEERVLRLREFEAKAFKTHSDLNRLMIRNR